MGDPSPRGPRLVTIFAVACGSLAMGCGSSESSAPEERISYPLREDAGKRSVPEASGLDSGVSNDAAEEDETAADAADDRADDPGVAPDDAGIAPDGPVNPCPVLTFPSGINLQTFLNPAMTATYADHLGTGESAPTCFIDVDNLVDPKTGAVYPITVNVATHFELEELVGTEVNDGYGHIVLMNPVAVESLEKFRETLNVPVSVISGFRSPKHQEAVCNSLCGNPLGCAGTCANNSRHLFGDAFDLPLQFYTTPDEDVACNVGFKFAYLESGTHLHVDQNPAYATCVIE